MVRQVFKIEQENGRKKERLQQKIKFHLNKIYTSSLMAKPSQVLKFSIIVVLTEIPIIVIICRRWQRNVGEDGRLGHRGPNFL